MKVLNILHQDHGYSLVELLTVLALLAISFTLAMPLYRQVVQHAELEVAARETTTQIRAAQTAAWSHGTTQELWFGRFNPSWSRWEQGQLRGVKHLPTSVRYFNGYLEHAVSVLRFEPDGRSSGSGRLNLTNSRGERATVTVTVNTGHVQYEGVRR